ncbi:MAG: LPS-assembly protein LptD [Mucilaginibacter polytrichastri]|nr:LPS-assembly protein LptD [Mucilaginibacter polytrichastri]
MVFAIHPAYSNVLSKNTVRDTIIQLDTTKDGRLLRPARAGNKRVSQLKNDTVPAKKDTSAGRQDTSRRKNQGEMNSKVEYKADDSIRIDRVNNMVYLYGKARVTYDDFELDADFIRLDQKTNQVYAKGMFDKTSRYVGRPIFKQGSDKPYFADSLTFNYKTKKGKIFNSQAEQEGNYISGGQAKKLNETEIAYRNVIYSTCSLPFPHTHYGVVITKGIAEKNQIISGPAYFMLEGVPIPVGIPFGFFPKPNKRASGIIFPSIGEDQQLGFFLRNFGYYLGISDYFDVETMASVFSGGSFELQTTGRYIKRYKYQGTVNLAFGSHRYGLEGTPATKDFNIRWSHTQDANAHPGTTFSASVNAGTSTFYQNSPNITGYNYNALTQNSLNSSISYGRTWTGTPFNLTASLSHRQDLTQRKMDLELPTVSFNMATINPLQSKNSTNPKWYEKLALGYSMQAVNRFSNIPDSTLFTSNTLKKLQTGFNHQVPVNLSLNVLKYFQVSGNFNYNERWYLQTVRKNYVTSQLGTDSLAVDTVQGFKRAGDYSFGASLATKLYGTYNFRGKGRLRAIRHLVTPTAGLSFRPDFGDPRYGYYQTIYSQRGSPYIPSYQQYSIFEQTPFGGPSIGRSASLNFAVDNTIEAKMRPKAGDTSQTDKKIPLLQGLSFASSYNFVADSFRLAPISFNGRTSVFNQKFDINFNGIFSPYKLQTTDTLINGARTVFAREIDQYTWQEGKFPRLVNFSFSFNFNLNSEAVRRRDENMNANEATGARSMMNQSANRLAAISRDPNAFVDFNIPWNVQFSFNFNYNRPLLQTNITSTATISGDLNVTPKWKVAYNSGYDFKNKAISLTQFSIYRDLHCWDMAFSWVPFGPFRSYSVDIRVRSSVLQDLKLSKRRNYYENSGF